MTEEIREVPAETSAQEVDLDGYVAPSSVPELPDDSTVSHVLGDLKSIVCRVDDPVGEVLLRLDISTVELQRHIRELNRKLQRLSR